MSVSGFYDDRKSAYRVCVIANQGSDDFVPSMGSSSSNRFNVQDLAGQQVITRATVRSDCDDDE